jgi:hypothetical protein
MIRTRQTVGSALLLCALSSPVAAQELPKWLVEAQSREARLPAPVALTSEDGWLRTQVPGKVAGRPVLKDQSYSFTIAVDDTLTVHCEVGTEARDLAGLLVASAEAGFAQVGKGLGEIEARIVEHTDAGAVGAHPYLGLQWLYRVKQQGQQRVGALHQFAANIGDAVLNCAHDQLGYARTFQTLTRMVASQLRTGSAEPPSPAFREVSVVHIDGAPVGVGTTTLSVDADGDTKVVNSGAMLIQVTPGQLTSEDSSEVQWVRPDGSLINAVHIKASKGEFSQNMSLKRTDGVWRAGGTIEGKAVDVALSAEPTSFIAQARARRTLMARPDAVGASTASMTWSALDPVRLLNSRATVLAADGPDAFRVREELGEITMDVVLDRQTGTMLSARMPIGPRTLSFQRVYRQGSF